MYRTLINNIYSPSVVDISNEESSNRESLRYAIYPIDKYVSDEVRYLTDGYCEYIARNICVSITNQILERVKSRFLVYVIRHEYKVAVKAGVVTTWVEYIRLTSDEEWIDYLNEKYPLLFDRLGKYISTLLNNISVLLKRLSCDYKRVCHFLKVSEDSKLSRVDLFMGDSHRNGQAVSRLFIGDAMLYYKPRSQCNELAFSKFMTFFRDDILMGDVTAECLSYDKYSWVKHVRNIEVSNENQINKYYYNLGYLLMIFYLLGTRDVISDNIIANGETPVFIDLECLLWKGHFVETQNYVQEYVMESVKQSCIVPHWGFDNQFERSLLQSSLTDNGLHNEHLPHFHANAVPIDSRTKEFLVKGFEDGYRYCIKNKENIKEFISREGVFNNATSRLLFHFTSVYEQIGVNLLYPEAFVDDKEYSKVRDILSRTIMYFSNQKYSDVLLNEIMEQLYIGDIPYFYSYAKTGDLYSSDGKLIVEGFFSKANAIELLGSRIDNLSDADLGNQVRLISGSIDLYLSLQGHQIAYSRFDSQGSIKYGFLDGAIDIGRNLLGGSTEIKGNLNWIEKTKDEVDERYDCMPLVYDMYSGLSGIAFYFVCMYRATGESVYLGAAGRILGELKEVFYHLSRVHFYESLGPIQRSRLGVSGYSFPMSGLVLMKHICSVDSSYLDDCFYQSIKKWYLSIFDDVENCDYLTGHAGALATFSLYSDRDMTDRIVERINSLSICTDNGLTWKSVIDGKEKEGLGGFSHGAAGIAAAMCCVKRSDMSEKLLNGALELDNSLFISDGNIWIDARNSNQRRDFSAWCHGSGGIALSRLLISDRLQRQSLKCDISIASHNIEKSSSNHIHCLCHGVLSNAEILRSSGVFLEDSRLTDVAVSWMNQVLYKVRNNPASLIYGDGRNQRMIGLFDGMSGIGYELLRFYDWKNIPSALYIENPECFCKYLHQ